MQYFIPKYVLEVCENIKLAGFEVYIVGGAIRDNILGKPSSDFDIASNAPALSIQKIFKRTVATGIQHGTITIMHGSHALEHTSFRQDGLYLNGRHPQAVSFNASLVDDLQRRDFTINSLAYDPFTQHLYDYHHGREDLKNKLIRSIGNAEQRFLEDGLRMLRACRFAAQLNFSITEATLFAIKKLHPRLELVSKPRILAELQKILNSPYPSRGLAYLLETGLLSSILPELQYYKKIKLANQTLWDFLLCALDNLEASFTLRLALLLRFLHLETLAASDINYSSLVSWPHKTSVRIIEDGKRPQKNSRWQSDLEALLRRLTCSNRDRREILALQANLLYPNFANWTGFEQRVFLHLNNSADLKEAGNSSQTKIWKQQLALGRALCRDSKELRELEELEEQLLQQTRLQAALSIKDLKVNGSTLTRRLGIASGPQLGNILKALLCLVLENPELNTEENLIEKAKDLL